MRILIVQTAFIGDVILITPLIKAVRQLYPDSVIDVMVIPAAVKLLENNPHLSSVISFPKHSSSLFVIYCLVRRLRRQGYQMVISPHSSARTHIVLWLAGIPQRIGFARGPAPFLLTARIPHPTGMHKISKNLNLLKLLSPREFDMQSELFPSHNDYAKADGLLKSLAGMPIVAIAPGSIWATKCLPIESYMFLCNNLLLEGFGIVLIGADTDRDKCNQLLAGIKPAIPKPAIINLAGSTNLLESAALIAKCKLMLCNDSGALHIANAMQVRVFTFFGPTVPAIGYYPFRKGDRVFETELSCRPCSSHGPQKCPLGHHNCMRQIDLQQVLSEVLTELKQSS